MPQFEYKTNKGTFVINSNRQLTNEELEQTISGKIGVTKPKPEGKVFGIAGSIPKSEFEAGRRNILGNIVDRPGSMARAAIRKDPTLSFLGPVAGLGGLLRPETRKATIEGAMKPNETFQEEGLRRFHTGVGELASKVKSPLLKGAIEFAGTNIGFGVSATGLVADVLTSPVDFLGLLVGKTPLGKGRTLGGVIGEAKPTQAVGRFLTKERGIPGRGKLQELNQAFKDVKNPTEFAQKVRNNLFQSKKQVGDNFEKGIRELSEANPAKTADLSDQFYQMKGSMADTVNNPGLASDINTTIRRIKDPQKASFIRDLIDNPENARNLTLQQVQDIKTTIQQAPSIATKLKQGKFADWKVGDLELLDLIDEIKLAQSDLFPEELAAIRKPYADYMGAYREVKNYFKPKVLLSKLRSGFGNEEIDNMIKVVLPKDTVNAMKGFRRLDLVKRNIGKVAAAGVGIEAGRRILGKTLGD